MKKAMYKEGFIYFLTNKYNKALYLGVTNNLTRRVAEHKAKINTGFTYKYNCDKLVYYETYPSIREAINREKQLKNWKREWKDALITHMNPDWQELSEDIGVHDGLIQAMREYYDCGSSPQ